MSKEVKEETAKRKEQDERFDAYEKELQALNEKYQIEPQAQIHYLPGGIVPAIGYKDKKYE